MIRQVYLVVLLILTIQSCAAIAPAFNALLGDKKGIDADAQIGSNDNKVKTGVGNIGDKSETSIEDNEGDVDVSNTSGRYHIESDKDIKVEIYETSNWIYAIFGLYFFSQFGLQQYAKYREKKKRYGDNTHYCSTSRSMANRKQSSGS